jgi:protein gp37
MFNKDRIDKGLYWDKAWSLVDGCTPVSPGCDHCWAELMNERFYKRKFSDVKFRADKLSIPGKTRNPTVFSVWNDLFHPAITDKEILTAVLEMNKNTKHIYLILTKRPKRMNLFFKGLKYGEPGSRFLWTGMPENIWLGVTAENQEMADKRIPLLLDIPASKRFVSVEPMLSEVNLINLKGPAGSFYQVLEPVTGRPALDWVICGAETGKGKRAINIEWARKLKDQCVTAVVPFFFKKDSKGSRVLDGIVWNQKPKI